MLHAIIMAGGSGTRFWPESRDLRPKQLLRVVGDRSMIQATVDRLDGLVPPERMLIATNAKLAGVVAEQLPELPDEAILGEPCKRDTAPCIGLAALIVSRHDAEATMAVMPSDHVIGPDAEFRQAIEFAAALVGESPGRIVTFGIRPTYPAETFGYIERGERLETDAAVKFKSLAPAFQVRQFREKPKADVAKTYVDSGNFYWNSGIFVWRAATILSALRQHQPEMFDHLQRISEAFGRPDYQAVLEREFAAIRGVSIDYAVMEHAHDVAVIEAPYGWDDVGSWQALARLHGSDENGNTVLGKHLGVNTSGTIVRGPADHLIVTLGLKDCVVVHTPDATLVANKHDEESIRQVVKLLQEKGWSEYL
ncbi:MAG: mannose-1-phosphate guanylyltransferase [Planctomycetia bacterium 21-64-5]|nr:MAG: mannose-1-phosphate guanylyltransferase [Planctomycetia bacterium 21-64-5]HQU42447.1 mannose-1-phosphate guanylyltransferase [Pirellulales bacterium]